MSERPDLTKQLDGITFQSFYYLKEELVTFCRQHGLPASGGKLELTDRISHFLDTGEIISPMKKTRKKIILGEIIDTTRIEPDFICSEQHRAFFRSRIGNSFSFSVAFQKWLKSNTGKTYSQAIEAYEQIRKDKKKTPKTIDKQFEYNTYIRDFFSDNQEYSLNDAIACWKYKKGIPGHNRYEKEDLSVLKGVCYDEQ